MFDIHDTPEPLCVCGCCDYGPDRDRWGRCENLWDTCAIGAPESAQIYVGPETTACRYFELRRELWEEAEGLIRETEALDKEFPFRPALVVAP